MQSSKEIWKRVLGELQIQVSKANYTTWLSDSHGLSYSDNILTVGVPSIFVAEWLSRRLYPLVRKTLISILGNDVDVQFLVHNGEQAPAPLSVRYTDGGTSTKAPHRLFNPKYTFDNLIVSDFNRLAYAAAMEVAENPGTTYNPLFIYSSTGQGKTHLLHAIGHLTNNHGLKAAYTTGEQFASEFVAAAKEQQIDQFRSKFRNINILLFDDVHFLVDKKQTLQCFFHTFNELYSSNRQIVITADCAPKDMRSLSSKVRSRLEGGLVVDIQQPDLETRIDILRAKTDKSMLHQMEEVLRVVAEKVCGNVRQLEGALVYLTAQAKLTGAKLTPQSVNKLLTSTACKQDIRAILQVVSEHFSLTVDDLTGKKRDRRTTLARHLAIYVIREDLGCSLTEIGRELGGRNHATVLHGHDKIAAQLRTNPSVPLQVAEIREKLSPRKTCETKHRRQSVQNSR